MCWKEHEIDGRSQMWGTVFLCAWRDWEKPRKTSVMMANKIPGIPRVPDRNVRYPEVDMSLILKRILNNLHVIT